MSSSPVNLEKYRIPLEEINRATNHFSLETQIGDGGFGMVYKGQLSEDWENHSVAIKRLNPKGLQGNEEYNHTNNNQFNNELKMVSVFKHPNIIPFIGFCDDEDEKIVVYELASNGSLEDHLRDSSKRRCLTWEQRLKICLGAAKGIKYLHSGVKDYKRVIHRDLKTGNILLNDNMEAKICDFGMSRLISTDHPNTCVRTNARGTNFYLDPVYIERKRLSKESDIYSFGVVMFEMSSGVMAYHPRRFEDVEEKYLLDLVRSYYDDHELVGGLDKLIDSDIKGEIDISSFHIFNEIAHECIHMEPKKRPTMDTIIERIEEALTIQISFQVNKESRKKNYMLGAKDLSIEWQDDTRYWKLGHIPESRFPEVYILKKVWWLEIHGEIDIGMLSQKSTYVAYLVFRTTKDCKGLAVPAKTRVSYDGIKMKTENVYLRRPQCVQENYVLPRQRKDGWMEIKLGEFECNEGDDGKVDMVFKENKTQNQKSGLIVEGIEIRPK